MGGHVVGQDTSCARRNIQSLGDQFGIVRSFADAGEEIDFDRGFERVRFLIREKSGKNPLGSRFGGRAR